jgi:hypothetical protein
MRLIGAKIKASITTKVPQYRLVFVLLSTILLEWRRDEGEGCCIKRARKSDYIQ